MLVVGSQSSPPPAHWQTELQGLTMQGNTYSNSYPPSTSAGMQPGFSYPQADGRMHQGFHVRPSVPAGLGHNIHSSNILRPFPSDHMVGSVQSASPVAGFTGRMPGFPSVHQATLPSAMPGMRSSHGSSSSSGTSNEVCMFFMRTGTCAFGTRCRFKHPLNRPQVQLNSGGYPIRPAVPNCAHYMSKGWCAFGTTCKFNHPEPGAFVSTMYAGGDAPPVSAPPSMFPYGMS